MSDRVCTKCGSTGPFSPDKESPDGLKSRCRKCLAEARNVYDKDRGTLSRKVVNARKIYNIDFLKLWEAQGGLCSLCGEKMIQCGQSNMAAAVDHDHSCCPPSDRAQKSCGKCVRGLIHKGCNLMIGLAQDRIEILYAAINYLRKGR